jgi:hypothetical protein
LFIVWSSNDGLVQSSTSRSLERAVFSDSDRKTEGFASDNYFKTPSVIVSINNNDTSSLSQKQNLGSLNVKKVLSDLLSNESNLGKAFDPASVSNVYKHIKKDFA